MKTITVIATILLLFCQPLAAQAAQQNQGVIPPMPPPFLSIAGEGPNDEDYKVYTTALKEALGNRYINMSNGFEKGFKWRIYISEGVWNKVLVTMEPIELPEALRYLAPQLHTYTLIVKADTPPDAAAAEVTVVMLAIQTSLKNGVVPEVPKPK